MLKIHPGGYYAWRLNPESLRAKEDRRLLPAHLRRLALPGGVIDLFSRQAIGWSMSSRTDKELAMSALLMAVWRRKPATEVLVHSNQGSQFSSYDWRNFLVSHNSGAEHEQAR